MHHGKYDFELLFILSENNESCTSLFNFFQIDSPDILKLISI